MGAGLLAKKLRAPRSFRMPASSLTPFASTPAPTFFGPCPLQILIWLLLFNTQAGREAAVLLLLILILILGAPLNHAGRTQALERG